MCTCVRMASSVCCWVRHARVVQCGCLLLGVCETFQRVSQRGYISPFVLQGPNLGNLVACVLLMNTATMPSFIHSYITCQTSVTNIPARAAAGRRGQNVRYIPAVWQRPTSGHVRPPSKHAQSFHLVLSFRETRARESLFLSQAIGSRNNMLLRSDGCFPSPALPPRRKGHDMRCARPWAVLDAQLLQPMWSCSDEGARLYAPNRGRPTGQPEDLESARLSRESRRGDRHPPLCFRAPT